MSETNPTPNDRTETTRKSRWQRMLRGSIELRLPEFDVPTEGSIDIDLSGSVDILGGTLDLPLPEFEYPKPPRPATP